MNTRPNIIYILADDLGYGDTSCYGAVKLHTPHVDSVARSGMKFTDCHSSSAVCTPSRYSVLTGRYCWRTELKEGVLKGFSPPLIDRDRLTVAEMLRQAGYSTACIGKWHLGLGWQRREDGSIDYSRPLSDSPIDHGFDYYFGISASLNMEPYCYIEDRHTVGIPSIPKTPVRRGQNPQGLMTEGWRDEAVNARMTEEVVRYLNKHAAEQAGKPFFLYIGLTGPHNPWVPSEAFAGKSRVGLRGDMILEMDWTVGEITAALRRLKLQEETLVLLTSDNGPHSFDIDERSVYGHDQTAGFRGQKADIWEGGHRVPFIASWPGTIPAGTVADETVELTDFMATCADIVGAKLEAGTAEDSFSILPVLLGESRAAPVREMIISHSWGGLFSIRLGKWKYIEGAHSGGFHWKSEAASEPDAPGGQLFDMEADAFERVNLYAQRPDVVDRLQRRLDHYREQHHSRT